jgi:plastocyanin
MTKPTSRRTRRLLAVPSALLVALVLACGGDDADTGGAPPSGGVATGAATAAASGGGQVSIASLSFGAPARVKAGARVTWTNRDDVPHTVTADDGSFKSANLERGGTFSHEFAKAGTFAYKCSIHGSMSSSVVVE